MKAPKFDIFLNPTKKAEQRELEIKLSKKYRFTFFGGRLFLCSIYKIKDVIGGCGVKRCFFITPPPPPSNCGHFPLKKKGWTHLYEIFKQGRPSLFMLYAIPEIHKIC